MRILVIGDSHTNAFMDQMSNITRSFIAPEQRWIKQEKLNIFINRLGPVLAYNISNYGVIEQLKNIKIDQNDRVILSFGEIDCRVHLRKRCLEDFSNVNDVINLCIEKYKIGIDSVRKLTPHVYTWFAIPPRNDEPFRKDFPYYGTYDERVQMIQIFNQKMKNLMGDNFLSIEDVVLKNGKALQEYYMDFIHVHPLKVKQFVDREISKIK